MADALASVHGDETFTTRHKFEYFRERLLTEDDGAEAVINALSYLRRKNPKIRRLGQVLTYFRRTRSGCPTRHGSARAS